MAAKIDLKPIDQQVVVVTGASSGIGLATAQSAAQRGATVALLARSAQTLDRLAQEIDADGGAALAVVADVAEPGQVARAVQQVLDRFGRIDTWVNNAGVSIYGRIEEVSLEDARRLFDVNFWGLVYGSLAVLPHLKRQGGALINVGSEVSEAVIPLQGFYSASKHAVKGFTDALRIELQLERAPVAVTLIQPTAVNTPFPEHARNYMDNAATLPTPQIDPQQVADAILDAATTVKRDVHVGTMSLVNTMVAKWMPSLGDRLAARQADRQKLPLPPLHVEGTLYVPGETGRRHAQTPAHS